MMNGSLKWLLYQLPVLLLMGAGCTSAKQLTGEFSHSFTVAVKNPLQQQREDVMVYLQEDRIRTAYPDFNANAFVVMEGEKEIPSQYNRKDSTKPGIVFVLDGMEANASTELVVRYNPTGTVSRSYAKRTQAELSHKQGGAFENRKYIGGYFVNVDSLRVPDEVTDHSYFIRYEGPGWESDKVGYRFYLDWRNGTDVFGKTTSDMVMQQVGLDGYDSYHNLQPWGMDVLKVGKSLGVGTLAVFQDGVANRVAETDSMISVITENGAVYSSIRTNYYGWKAAGLTMDVHSQLGIHAGSRLTHHAVQVTGDSPQNLSTGIIKDKKARLHSSKGEGSGWGYVASYGKQSLNGEGDNLGIAVLFRAADLIDFAEDANSHVVQLRPSKGKAEYYFLAAWELEPSGITNEEQFLEYLEKTAQELGNPVQVVFGTSQSSR